VTVEEVDQELALWKKSLGAAAQNLMDLNSLPTYQRLAGSNGVPKAALEGVTAARVYPALDSMGRLFQNFDDLQSSIERAAELRKSISPIFGSEQKLREIEAILHGKSVKVLSAPVPIEQRTLSTGVENVEWVTPGDVMGAMARSFTAARDVVMAVDAAWEKLGMGLDQAMTEIAAFNAEGEHLPALASAQAALDAIRNRIENDPLGSAQQFDTSVAPILNQARSAVAALKAKRSQVETGLRNATRLLSEWKDLHLQSVAAWNECKLKITCPREPPAPISDDQIMASDEWLQRLADKFREGLLDPILVGLERWNKAAAGFVSQDRAVLLANEAPVKERNELRGRLEALKAKARARNCAEDPELTRIAAQATQILFNRPTPIEKAATLLLEYERTLRARSGGKNQEIS